MRRATTHHPAAARSRRHAVGATPPEHPATAAAADTVSGVHGPAGRRALRGRRRTVGAATAALLTAALLAAGCGTGSPGATPTSTTAPGTVPATASGPTGDGGTSPAAPGEQSAARTPMPSGVRCEQPIAVGYFGAITGNSANLSVPMLNATQMAVEEFNAQNPECRVELRRFDSQGAPEQAPALAEAAVRDGSLVAIVGLPFSGEAKTAGPILDEAGLPFVAPGAVSPAFTAQGWTAFHRLVAGADLQMDALGRWLAEEGYQRIAVVDDGTEYGAEVAAQLGEAFTSAGGQVVVTDRVDPKAADLSATATKLIGAQPEAVFFGGYYEAGGRLAKQAYDLGLRARFVGPHGVLDQGFLVAAGPAASEGALLSGPMAPPSMVPGGAEWAERYRETFGTAPSSTSMEAYDGAAFVLHLVGQGARTREAVQEGLDTASYQGLTGLAAFNPDGSLKLGDRPAVWIYRVRDGAIEPVGPAS